MRSLPSLTALLFLVIFAPCASAQVIAVHFKSEKAAKRYKAHLVEFRGEQVVIGEPKSGIVWKPEENNLVYIADASNELFVVSPKDPSKFAYFIIDGERVAATKKNKLTIQGHHIAELTMLMRDQTLPGLAKEYNLHNLQIEEFLADRDSYEKGSRDWQARHVRLVTAMERLRGWLLNTGYPGAIKQLDKDIKKQKKVVLAEGIRARGEQAMASVKRLEVPEELIELAQEISEGKDEFGSYESQHVLIHCIKRSEGVELISDHEVVAALTLAEKVIEGFRAEFVDPYLDEQYQDFIPDRHFAEFLFVPEDLPKFEHYTAGFWGISWTANRDSRLAQGGGASTGGLPTPHFRYYWKKKESLDLQGIICHQLGHSLAALHYSAGRLNLEQDWLEEAVGYYISFEYLGRNNVTCMAFNKEKSGYVKREKPKVEGEKVIATGRRDVYNEVALSQGRSIDRIALRTLFELEDADLAKSWSLYDYIARKEGKSGQQWLRAAGEFSVSRSTFLANWREAAATILEVSPAEAFRALEKRWRTFAESEQQVE